MRLRKLGLPYNLVASLSLCHKLIERQISREISQNYSFSYLLFRERVAECHLHLSSLCQVTQKASYTVTLPPTNTVGRCNTHLDFNSCIHVVTSSVQTASVPICMCSKLSCFATSRVQCTVAQPHSQCPVCKVVMQMMLSP